jgi:uncharacterized repeat protein (TIGR04076 family)
MSKAFPLKVEVVEVKGKCPVYQKGDYFFVREGYLLALGNRESLCLHSLSCLLPYYVALARGIEPQDLGLAGAGGRGAYLQCLDPCSYTGGGTVVFKVIPQPSSGPQNEERAYPRRPLVGVGGVIFDDGKVLLIRRGVPPNKGMWSLPGGAVEAGERLGSALEREVWEECRIKVRTGNIVAVFESIYRDSKGRSKFHYVIIDFLAEYLEGQPQPGSDVTDLTWVSLDEALKLDLTEGTRKLLSFLKEKKLVGTQPSVFYEKVEQIIQ